MTLVKFIEYIAVLISAILLGKWFDSNRKISKLKGLPWYTPWLSAPGILIILILSILISIRIFLSTKS